jgi:hypothetical protein
MHINVHDLKHTTLGKAPQDKIFWVCRGDQIDNLTDLANCIETLTPEQFHHHVNWEGKKNDFATWILDVFKNPSLARDLNYEINFKDQKHYAKTIKDHLAWLHSA